MVEYSETVQPMACPERPSPPGRPPARARRCEHFPAEAFKGLPPSPKNQLTSPFVRDTPGACL